MATAKKTTKSAPKKTVKKAVLDDFAVIATGGKQYRVSVGELITIEKLPGEYKKGDTVSFDQVLLVHKGGTTIGTPTVSGVTVAGEIAVVGRAPKVTVIKYKQKSRYFKKNGHRQPYLKIKITSIK
ncbi:50S ribosomal protein L21 [Candidatus Nomurabacteria bacterium]|nr:50S ribosomal protein L21 [Candidatus Nomurabacteria bacterium]